MSRGHHGQWRVYRTPTLIALASLVGLVSALIGDGVFNVVSWIALGMVPCIVAWALLSRRRHSGK